MSCDIGALLNLDTADPEQINDLLHQCMQIAFDPMLWFWAIAFTIIGAAVGAWIGKRKHAVVRDAILGAALGPIGWIISLALPQAIPKPACPACKREVDAGDLHCRHCGAKLPRSP
jgi:hypothetical protein